MLGIGLGITSRLRSSVFNPASLFRNGEQGWLYDLPDMSTLFQDAAGTTPVTGVNQPVGLCLDKSKGLVLGPERLANAAPAVTGTATAASYNTSTGAGNCTRVDAANQSWVQFSGLTAGAHRVAITNTGAVALFIRAGAGLGAVTYAVLPLASLTATFVATSGAFSVTCDAGTASFVVNSVRELPGNHRSQSASLPRPTYARHPMGGIRNRLTFTQEFENPAWLKLASGTGAAPSVTANAGTAPDGTATADRVVFNRGAGTTAGDISRLFQEVADPASGSGVTSFYVRSFDGVSSYSMRLWAGLNEVNITVTGAWQRFEIASVGTTFNCQLGLVGNQNQQNADVLVWGAQGEYGSTATAYQRVVSAFDVTEAGKPDLYYLAYDGSDDFLSTAPFAWGTDKATVVAGVRKLSDAATGMLVETSVNATGSNGAFYITAPELPNDGYAFLSKGTNNAGVTRLPLASYPAPITSVFTGIGDISGDVSRIRINGVQVGQSTGEQGTGNFGTHQAFFGARGGSSLFFNGREYSQFAINRLLTANELAQLERWTAQKTGVTIP